MTLLERFLRGASMQRYFIDVEYNHQPYVKIYGDDFHHIVRVMRMEAGEKIVVVFNHSQAAIAQINEITDEYVQAEIKKIEAQTKELPIEVAIVSGMPKGDKMEWVIQKGTELGATQFIPFVAERSIVKWEEKKAKKKLERWGKIAKEAAEQSQRQKLPLIFEPKSFKHTLPLLQQYDVRIVAYEEAAKNNERGNLVKVLQAIEPNQRICIVFGPEGGLSDQEINELQNQGFIICGLGPRILRTETAPLYVLSAISYQLELMR